MMKSSIKKANEFNLIISNEAPDVIEPITAFLNCTESLQLNRKQFGECMRFAYGRGGEGGKPFANLRILVNGDVTEWRTYSICTEAKPEFLELLENISLGGQWIFQPMPKVIQQVRSGIEWNHQMIRLGANLGRKLILTQHSATNDYSLRTTAPSVYKLAESMGATVHYTGALRDELINPNKK